MDKFDVKLWKQYFDYLNSKDLNSMSFVYNEYGFGI